MGSDFNFAEVRQLLDKGDFEHLFVEHLGWERNHQQHAVRVGEQEFRLTGVAHKRATIAMVCRVGAIPPQAVRQRIQRQVAKLHHENLVIFITSDGERQCWQWEKRAEGKPIRTREHTWRRGTRSGQLLERVLPRIRTTLAEEDRLSQVHVNVRFEGAFDVEKVTKRFFERFQAEHKAFHKFIDGLEEVADRDWYASVMLNRLMFCYFIQKKGLLNGEHDYLRDRLKTLQATKGKDKFWSFYREFLLRLFHEGLSTKANQRAKELDALIGKIPYLNGGLFDVHELESKHKGIKIPDEAFERLFDFFDEYRWHLDETELANRAPNEINPDVLGYIFEKYINQKQMGAYYTKEDITEYISKNTIIPFILDQAAKNCAIAFKAAESGSVWRLLKNDPDRYIYDAVLHGVIDDGGKPIALPAEIEAGVKDLAKRGGWNKPAAAPFALPTETWREHVARRQRCLDLRDKLAKGEVQTVNDLVTLNLDIRQFAQDVILNAEGPDLLRAVWKAVEGVTVLDPTCGSGAFLFAALNILEPLYEACLDRMESFLDDLKRAEAAGEKVHAEKFKDFKAILAEVNDSTKHASTRYFILKSIVVNNLYGVDIMEEACEICKLRLFLKLVAQVEEGVGGIEKIEPLPDIDFNVRAGNTLVGFTTLDAVRDAMSQQLDFGKAFERITEQAEAAATAFRLFRKMHTTLDVSAKELADGKRVLRTRLDALHDKLNQYLAEQHNKGGSKAAVEKWAEAHQPFHWLVDFYSIVSSGGFDVIIGNPPYVGVSEVKYLLPEDRALGIPDLYGYVLLRTRALTKDKGRCGMIVPLSLCFSDEFAVVRRHLATEMSSWYSSFDNIPAALFAGVSQRCTIWLGQTKQTSWSGTTSLQRWRSATRAVLFPNLSYSVLPDWNVVSDGIPRIGGSDQFRLVSAMSKAARAGLPIIVPSRRAKHFFGFAPAARNFMSGFVEPPPCLDAGSLAPVSTSDAGAIGLPDERTRFAALAIFVGELHFWHWLTHGDGFHVTVGTVSQAIEVFRTCDEPTRRLLESLGHALHRRRFEALVFKKNAGKYVGNFNYRGHAAITRRSDLLILGGLGFGREAALELFGQVQRLLAINESAGEKSIPAEVKAKFLPTKIDQGAETRLFRDVDALLTDRFEFTSADLMFLFNKDVTYRVGPGVDE